MVIRLATAALVGAVYLLAALPAKSAITDSAIYVAKTGADANPGSRAQPKLTIAAGIAQAQSQGVPNVLVAKGTYTETLTLPNGVSLFGGFDEAAGWPRSSSNFTTILSVGAPLRVVNYTTPGQVEGFTIQASAASAPGSSAIAVLLDNAGGLRLSRNTIVAGVGLAGAAGANGIVASPATAATGNFGTGGCQGAGCGIGGAALVAACGNGGKGGNGGFNTSNGQAGSVGSSGASGGTPGVATGQCFSQSGGGGPGGAGANGGNGAGGSGGSGGTASSLGWVSTPGNNGADGTNGAGGGGGGGGGGGSNLLGGFPSCTSDTGGGGGSGGAGGCGGDAGQGGGGGGASIAVLAVNSATALILENTINAQGGGRGGKGGDGRAGQTGGPGGSPGPAFDDAGAGNVGGKGGNGGAGGGGGGGAGGPAYGVYSTGGALLVSNSITTGPAGLPGQPGNNGSTGTAGIGGAGASGAVFGTSIGASQTLTVTKTGGGAGTVSSDMGFLDCGGACSEIYAPGLVVALTPSPAADSVFAGWTGACTGTGACNVTMDAAKSVTAEFKLATTIPRLVNIATRMQVLTGADVLIGGFIIGGSAPKTVVVRARGPSLVAAGVPNALANPVLQLFSGAAQIDSNDNWQQAANAATIQSSGLAPSDPLESAIHTTLNPGAYTAIVTGASLGTGVAIIEVFEVDVPQVPLLNIATRGKVLTGGDVMIGGFIIQGDAPQTVVVRARGPSLAAAGVPGALQDTVLQLFAGAAVIASNDDWQASPDAAVIQSAGFAPSDTRESVIRMTLSPGAYTAIVTGKNGATGVGIIEVFAQ